MKHCKKLLSLVLIGIMLFGVVTVCSASDSIPDVSKYGKSYTYRYTCTESKVTGSVSCPTARSCAVKLNVYYFDRNGESAWDYRPLVNTEPGTSAYDIWQAGTGEYICYAHVMLYVDDVQEKFLTVDNEGNLV